MATEKTPKYTPAPDGFDVTCIVGRVTYGGDKDPFLVAMDLVAGQKARGLYQFPHETGVTVSVHIDWDEVPADNQERF